MLNRRDFLKASGICLTTLVNNSEASPRFNSFRKFNLNDLEKDLEEIRKEGQYTRESMIISYEEWKSYEEAPKDPRTSEDIRQLINAEKIIKEKAKIILKHEDKAYGLLTKQERQEYESELKMLEPSVDKTILNIKYGLNFTTEQLERNLGARLFWFLDRNYSYKYSDEKAKRAKK